MVMVPMLLIIKGSLARRIRRSLMISLITIGCSEAWALAEEVSVIAMYGRRPTSQVPMIDRCWPFRGNAIYYDGDGEWCAHD
jgi:hypothetical protein